MLSSETNYLHREHMVKGVRLWWYRGSVDGGDGEGWVVAVIE